MYLKLHPDFKATVDEFLQKDDEHSESTSHDLSDSVELEELKISEEKQRSRLKKEKRSRWNRKHKDTVHNEKEEEPVEDLNTRKTVNGSQFGDKSKVL